MSTSNEANIGCHASFQRVQVSMHKISFQLVLRVRTATQVRRGGNASGSAGFHAAMHSTSKLMMNNNLQRVSLEDMTNQIERKCKLCTHFQRSTETVVTRRNMWPG